jgi:hypothetical protein
MICNNSLLSPHRLPPLFGAEPVLASCLAAGSHHGSATVAVGTRCAHVEDSSAQIEVGSDRCEIPDQVRRPSAARWWRRWKITGPFELRHTPSCGKEAEHSGRRCHASSRDVSVTVAVRSIRRMISADPTRIASKRAVGWHSAICHHWDTRRRWWGWSTHYRVASAKHGARYISAISALTHPCTIMGTPSMPAAQKDRPSRARAVARLHGRPRDGLAPGGGHYW